MSWIDDVVRGCYREVRTDAIEADLANLVGHDRFQASEGIEQAASYVADRATEAGLEDVEILRFPADGRRRWWSYAAPVSWTPRTARLCLLDEAGRREEPLIRYPEQPYRLAYQSRPTPDAGRTTPLVLWSRQATAVSGCTVVFDRGAFPTIQIIEELTEAGAAGLVIGAGQHADDLAHRLELPPGSPLFGFSLAAAQMGRIVSAAAAGRSAHVTVSADNAGAMPVVTASLVGTEPGGMIVYAHLCHPAPGANDNASGVAAALAVARLAADHRARLRRTVQFLWGPEFVGLAAYLHERGRAARIDGAVAVNLDMVGEDQARCGGPLIVERGPDHLPSFVSAIVERCVAALPARHRSFSGAVGCDTWSWRATPFVGGSDQLLLADPSVNYPGVQLGHWPDRYHHTSGDTLDKVDLEELRRVVATTAGALHVVAAAGPAELPELEGTVTAWGADLVRGCMQPPPDRAAAEPDAFDPWATEARTGLLRHRLAVAAGSVQSLSILDGGGGDDRRGRAVQWLEQFAGHLSAWLDLPMGPAGGPDVPLRRRWSGPFNLRAFREDAAADDRVWLDAELAARGRAGYALAVALAYAVDGVRTGRAAQRAAAYASLLPITPAFADRYFAALHRAGWIDNGEIRY